MSESFWSQGPVSGLSPNQCSMTFPCIIIYLRTNKCIEPLLQSQALLGARENWNCVGTVPNPFTSRMSPHP